MPSGFPTDFPIYPGARLTGATQAAATGSTKWTLEWQTLDKVNKIQSIYVPVLDQGDWVLLAYSGTVDTKFSATFSRKSNSKVSGDLEVTISGGVTKIDLVLNTIP